MFSIQVMESENTMPPIAAPTPQSLYQDFEIKYKDWSQSSFHCLSELREDREISMKMTNEIINGYESVQEVGLNIQDLEPDHANLFPYLTSQMEGVKILWKICLLKLFKGRSVEELEADVRNHFRYENDGKEVPALKTKNADKQMVATKIDQQEQECHARSDEEQGNTRPEESLKEEEQGNCSPKLPSISEIEIKNVSNDAENLKIKETNIETFSNSPFIHATYDNDLGKVEPGDTNFPGLDKSFDNKPTRPDVDLVVGKEDAKKDSTLGMFTNAEEDAEPATKRAVPALVAKKAAARKESFSDEDEDSSGGEEEKPAAQPVVRAKPAAAKEASNSDDLNSDGPKEAQPASKVARPAAKPSKKEEPPDGSCADGSDDVKKPAANKEKKPAPGKPMDEEGADSAPHKKEEKVDIEVAPQEKEEKEARVHSSLCVVASQEGEKEADADVASREEKEEVDADVDVDATRLDKTMEVSDEENHPVEEVQLKSDELFENDDHSKENDEVNGSKYDQAKIEELFETIAIFLFSPNYKYRKKRWPGKT